ncbi:hypothetical protein ACOME3_001253 [Neoechinorhynchus agilis]
MVMACGSKWIGSVMGRNIMDCLLNIAKHGAINTTCHLHFLAKQMDLKLRYNIVVLVVSLSFGETIGNSSFINLRSTNAMRHDVTIEDGIVFILLRQKLT